ncbi:MAG: hypothetical protein JF616_21765 [Fibrobacteres bacterium]|nr:hypothetical protein [Fibrobacterota bacterium]
MGFFDPISNPGAWRPISREEALRLRDGGNVMVVHSGPGFPVALPFGPDSPFSLSSGPYDYASLRYFVANGLAAPMLVTKGRTAPPPSRKAKDEADAAEEAPPEQEAEEPPKKIPTIRIVKLDCECFAPMEETVLVQFSIDGDVSLAESIHLRVESEAKPGQYLVERKLDVEPKASGTFQWDGQVTDGAYPGCLNPSGSPYQVQLGLAAGGSPVFTNKVGIKVELVQTELAVGDPAGMGEDDGRGNKEMMALLKDELKKTPDQATIRLPGSFFKDGLNEMESSASFTVYGERLKEGLGVPLFVTLWVKGKDGKRKRAPKAVAGTRILWDAVPDDEGGLDANLSDRGVHPQAKKFLKGIGAYKQDKTEPKGHTAHWELGGIRAVEQARKSGREQWGNLDGAWSGEALKKRTWGGRSLCGKAGEATADSGMLYFNGRIAGDRYRVSVYADLDGSLDDKEPDLAKVVPAERKSKVVALRNWRDVRITASYKIGASTTPLSFDGPNREYRKAALSVVPNPGLIPVDIKDKWKAAYQATVKSTNESFVRDAALDDPGLYPVRYLDPEDYWQKTNTDAGFFGKIWHRIKAFFGATNESDYRKKCDKFAYVIYSKAVRNIQLGKDGLTCIKFGARGDHNQWKDSYTVGIAPSIGGYTNRTQAVLLIFHEGHPDGTVIHEMGHNLFLPHAPGHWEPGKNPDGFKPLLHDRSQICIMSYHPSAQFLCGLCMLRLAGWNHGSINNDGTVFDLMDLE